MVIFFSGHDAPVDRVAKKVSAQNVCLLLHILGNKSDSSGLPSWMFATFKILRQQAVDNQFWVWASLRDVNMLRICKKLQVRTLRNDKVVLL